MDLLSRCLAGEPGAWDLWVAEVAPVIRRTVVHVLRRHTHAAPEEDAADAVQEVFLRLVCDDCRLLRAYDPARSSLRTWLTLVARSVAIDLLRRRRLRLVPLEDRMPDLPAPEPDEPTPLAIPEGLLTPRQQLVLRLLFHHELEVPEAARLLGVDEQTVRSTKHKALAALRKHLGARPGRSGMSSG